jgi:hypothetical protein
VLESRFFAEATDRFWGAFVTSRATTVTGDYFERIVFENFPKVGAQQLRCSAVRRESPQLIDIRRIAAIASGGVEVVSAD